MARCRRGCQSNAKNESNKSTPTYPIHRLIPLSPVPSEETLPGLLNRRGPNVLERRHDIVGERVVGVTVHDLLDVFRLDPIDEPLFKCLDFCDIASPGGYASRACAGEVVPPFFQGDAYIVCASVVKALRDRRCGICPLAGPGVATFVPMVKELHVARDEPAGGAARPLQGEPANLPRTTEAERWVIQRICQDLSRAALLACHAIVADLSADFSFRQIRSRSATGPLCRVPKAIAVPTSDSSVKMIERAHAPSTQLAL